MSTSKVKKHVTKAKGRGKGHGPGGKGAFITANTTVPAITAVWHAHFTGGDPSSAKSHLRACGGGPGTGKKCDALNCGKDAAHGAHVYTVDQGPGMS